MIITLPNSDLVTEYLSQFSKLVIEIAEKRSIIVKKLKGKDLSKKEFEKVLKNVQSNFVFLNGHGSETKIFGNKDEPILVEGENDYLLAEKITYARSCDAGYSLGKSIVKLGKETCFIGYDLPFEFYYDINWIGNPLRDKIAFLFFDPSNLIPLSILKGNTSSEADKKSKNALLKNINKVIKEKSPEAFTIASSLWNNYSGQIVLGNKNAKLNL
ncbi:MAG: hypothetical protein WC584_02105 [Candidatus Pacearchaeota archaeon]